MAQLVLDASVAIALLLEEDAVADFSRIVDVPAAAPSHWPLEVANGLLMAARRQRVLEDALEEILAAAAMLDVTPEATGIEIAVTRSFELAQRHNLTLYDAAYLELAIREDLPLASFDKRLRDAATVEGVLLLP
ncbi:PIN domain-containing protein [Roseococcus sp. SYP-B2431]|uniref:type II toxin-antitoxin system VapC family toxin n=1 Tax=Roseococcus sp. SYP-B2431 TaxID=2496640 RepID=UPI00103DF006|nr:type II toxin-antitoxin system VapC family toxin [Roseococcus sp. SYP-B2431]TCH97020.1 PIN domain-containing protein [Roseococcus sp. SYP-B2431]